MAPYKADHVFVHPRAKIICDVVVHEGLGYEYTCCWSGYKLDYLTSTSNVPSHKDLKDKAKLTKVYKEFTEIIGEYIEGSNSIDQVIFGRNNDHSYCEVKLYVEPSGEHPFWGKVRQVSLVEYIKGYDTLPLVFENMTKALRTFMSETTKEE
jgi:hypothetical protein